MRTVVPAARGGHLPLRAAWLFLLCVSLEVFATPTRRYHGRMLTQPSPPACATPEVKGCSHTRRFGTLASPSPPVIDMPWDPIPLAINQTDLLLTFVRFHAEFFFQIFPFLAHRCFRCRNFHSLRHRNKFVNQNVEL